MTSIAGSIVGLESVRTVSHHGNLDSDTQLMRERRHPQVIPVDYSL
jgi:hypothetical protein